MAEGNGAGGSIRSASARGDGVRGRGDGRRAAGLAAAIRPKQLQPDLSVVVLEKGSEVGSHTLSGVVVDPVGPDALIPQWRSHDDRPLTVEVTDDRFYYLGPAGGMRLPNALMPKLMSVESGLVAETSRTSTTFLASPTGRTVQSSRNRNMPEKRAGVARWDKFVRALIAKSAAKGPETRRRRPESARATAAWCSAPRCGTGGSPAASARIHPVLRCSVPGRPSRNSPAEAATRSCVNKGHIRAFTSRSDEAHNSNAVSIEAPAVP